MDKEWTLHVEDFAKIQIADVKISPLICFVGDNNSGKSYLMSLLWGILTLGKEIFPKSPSDTVAYTKCEKWLKENIDRDIGLTDDVITIYIAWFNELLKSNKKIMLKKLFNYKVDAEKIEIIKYKRRKRLEIRWDGTAERYSVTGTYVKFPKPDSCSREQLLRMNAYICWNILMEGIAEPLYTPIVRGRRMGEPVYLPASRTGFMLTYPQLIENSLQVSFALGSQENSSALTLPYIDFLQLITKFEPKYKLSQGKKKIIQFIEKNMTKGSISVQKEMMPVIKYRPEEMKEEIPLYMASSIISEIAPLLLLFRSDINFKTLIIEEPEAHLHPELQQKMAQLIIQLIRSGIPVWITTHSDTILQHMNNMLKLKDHAFSKGLMEEYGYSKEDLLNVDEIAMYQFMTCQDGKTRLEPLECTKYGFVVPTFNEALEKIVQEVYAFQED